MIKKIISLLLVVALSTSMFCGCSGQVKSSSTDKELATSHETKITSELKGATAELKKDVARGRMHVHKTDSKPNDETNESDETTENHDTEDEIGNMPTEALAPLWVAENKIEFTISDNTYFVGDSCYDILNTFEVVEINGDFTADCLVPTCEKIVIELCDTNGNSFLIVIRNDMNQPILLNECTLHEVIVDADSFNLFNFQTMKLTGNSPSSNWINVLGSNYSDMSYLDVLVYSWQIAEKCYIDISFAEDNVTPQRICVMTY